MFDEYYTNVDLTVGEIYFLAKELNMEQIVGFGIDFDSLNKETKNELKAESYELFEKQKAIQMNFTGDTIVSPKYMKVIKSLEFPEQCSIIQHCDLSNNKSSTRHIYFNDDIWTAFDCISNECYSVYLLPNSEIANDFLFCNIKIDANENQEELEEIKLNNVDELYKIATDIVVITEYFKDEGTYRFVQTAFAKIINKGWFGVVMPNNDESIVLNCVTELIRV
jgi:hypothetical protein